MKYIKFFFIISLLAVTSCKTEEKPITLQDDKVHKALEKGITELEADKESLKTRNQNLEKKIGDVNSNHKFLDLLRKQRFANLRYIELVDQNIALLKIKYHEREKYLADNQSKLKLADLDQQFEDYKINKSVNPESFPWRRLAPIEKEKKAATPPPATDGHGAPAEPAKEGHGEAPAASPAHGEAAPAAAPEKAGHH